MCTPATLVTHTCTWDSHTGLCGALPCPHPQPPDKHFWVLHDVLSSGRDQRRTEAPEGDAQPQAGALPFHTPPWRGPLGTKGEILHMQTSWLAPGTGERTPVSTSLPGHTKPIPPSRVITAQAPGPGDCRRPAWFQAGSPRVSRPCGTPGAQRPPPWQVNGLTG